MIPSLWFWAPQFHYPLSGAVQQRIDPDWFFGAIQSQAGNGAIEKKAFDVASYGSQLGWITALLLADDAEAKVPPGKVDDARKKLRDAYKKIEEVKAQTRAELKQSAEAALERLRLADPSAYRLVLDVARSAPDSE